MHYNKHHNMHHNTSIELTSGAFSISTTTEAASIGQLSPFPSICVLLISQDRLTSLVLPSPTLSTTKGHETFYTPIKSTEGS